MCKRSDTADILIELVAQGGGNEALDPLYDLIAEHPGSRAFTLEQGRDALLMATARIVQLMGEHRRNRESQDHYGSARNLVHLSNQFGRLSKLALFLERSMQEVLLTQTENMPVRQTEQEEDSCPPPDCSSRHEFVG